MPPTAGEGVSEVVIYLWDTSRWAKTKSAKAIPSNMESGQYSLATQRSASAARAAPSAACRVTPFRLDRVHSRLSRLHASETSRPRVRSSTTRIS